MFDALLSVGISEDLSDKAYREICQLALLMNNGLYSAADVNRVLKSFKG